MSELEPVLAALRAEADEFDTLLAGLSGAQWRVPTPAPGWTVAHQVAHLAATFRLAGLSASDPAGFGALVSRLGDDFEANVATALQPFLADDPAAGLAHWHRERAATLAALAALPPETATVPWLVNPLPPAVLASAGLTELFAHGQDVRDAVGAGREVTDRIRPIVAFGVRTRDFGYRSRNLVPPAEEFSFSLRAPSGAQWQFGPAGATQRITGPAVDFCLLVTRRRHHADLALEATGEHAAQWLELAQAYRGAPGAGRRPGQFAPAAAR